jgi:hypothetical protein
MQDLSGRKSELSASLGIIAIEQVTTNLNSVTFIVVLDRDSTDMELWLLGRCSDANLNT